MGAQALLFVGLTAMLFLGGAALAFWCVRTVSAERQRKAFDPEETAALEAAVGSLIEQLKAAADETIERAAQASQHLSRLIATAEGRMETLWTQEWGAAEPPPQPQEAAESQPKPEAQAERASVLDTDYVGRTAEVYRLADQQLDEAAIAQRTGLEPAEVKVLLSLRGMDQPPG